MSGVWTIEALKEHFDVRLAAMDRAVTKAEMTQDERLNGMNEFRNQLNDQQKTFISRDYYDAQHRSLEEKITAVDKKVSKVENLKEGGNIVWAYIVSGISLFLALISVAIKFIK